MTQPIWPLVVIRVNRQSSNHVGRGVRTWLMNDRSLCVMSTVHKNRPSHITAVSIRATAVDKSQLYTKLKTNFSFVDCLRVSYGILPLCLMKGPADQYINTRAIHSHITTSSVFIATTEEINTLILQRNYRSLHICFAIRE